MLGIGICKSRPEGGDDNDHHHVEDVEVFVGDVVLRYAQGPDFPGKHDVADLEDQDHAQIDDEELNSLPEDVPDKNRLDKSEPGGECLVWGSAECDQRAQHHDDTWNPGEIESKVQQAPFCRLCEDEDGAEGKDLTETVDQRCISGLLIGRQKNGKRVSDKVDAEKRTEDGKYPSQFFVQSRIDMQDGRPVKEMIGDEDDRK